MAFDGKSLAIIVLVGFIVYILFFSPKNSAFRVELEGAPIMGEKDTTANKVETKTPPKQMKTTGNDVDTSAEMDTPSQVTPDVPSGGLLPKEVPVSDDFGQFSTDAILSGQNYLDPRAQIGYPETVGGTLRNANLQIRSEPANPRDPVSIWNLSTITPEKMRPQFELEQDKEYA